MLKSSILAGLLVAVGAGGGTIAYRYMLATNPAPSGVDEKDASESNDAAAKEPATEPSERALAFNILGGWVSEGGDCASGEPSIFKPKGVYWSQELEGTWKLDGDALEINYDGTHDRGRLSAVSDHEFKIKWSDGGVERYRRCVPGGSEPWPQGETSEQGEPKAGPTEASMDEVMSARPRIGKSPLRTFPGVSFPATASARSAASQFARMAFPGMTDPHSGYSICPDRATSKSILDAARKGPSDQLTDIVSELSLRKCRTGLAILRTVGAWDVEIETDNQSEGGWFAVTAIENGQPVEVLQRWFKQD